MEEMKLLNHEQIMENTYIVTENYSADKRFTIGVIVGAERVLVIDTGFGMAGDLRKYIEGFAGTGMPMFCICTHGHSDVLGAAAQFDEAYLKKNDVGMFPEFTDPEQRIDQLKMFTKNNAQMVEYGKRVMLDNSKVQFKDLKDGDHFQLGGAEAEIIEIPGHTPGSIAVRVTREGFTTITFAGDAVSSGMNHLLRMDRQGLNEYAERLERMMFSLNRNEPVYCTHSQVPMTPTAGFAVAKACREVADGFIKGDPAFSFGPAREDRKQPDFRIHFTDNYYIVYNADLM